MPMHVVDCGSGGTRFRTFSKHMDGLVHDQSSRLEGKVVNVMATVVPGGACSAELLAWLDALDGAIKETGIRLSAPKS